MCESTPRRTPEKTSLYIILGHILEIMGDTVVAGAWIFYADAGAQLAVVVDQIEQLYVRGAADEGELVTFFRADHEGSFDRFRGEALNRRGILVNVDGERPVGSVKDDFGMSLFKEAGKLHISISFQDAGAFDMDAYGIERNERAGTEHRYLALDVDGKAAIRSSGRVAKTTPNAFQRDGATDRNGWKVDKEIRSQLDALGMLVILKADLPANGCAGDLQTTFPFEAIVVKADRDAGLYYGYVECGANLSNGEDGFAADGADIDIGYFEFEPDEVGYELALNGDRGCIVLAIDDQIGERKGKGTERQRSVLWCGDAEVAIRKDLEGGQLERHRQDRNVDPHAGLAGEMKDAAGAHLAKGQGTTIGIEIGDTKQVDARIGKIEAAAEDAGLPDGEIREVDE